MLTRQFSRSLYNPLYRHTINYCMGNQLINIEQITCNSSYQYSNVVSSHCKFIHTTLHPWSSSGIPVPNLGDSISEGTIVSWSKSIGDYCNADEVVVVLETDKVSVDIRTPKSGILTKQYGSDGDTVKVGDNIFEIDTDGKKPAQSSSDSKSDDKPTEPKTESVPQSQPPSSTAVKQSTPEHKQSNNKSTSTTTSKITDTVATSGMQRNERRIPMTRMRKTIANRLKSAQNNAAMLTTFNEIDMTNIMLLRNKYKDEFLERHGVKLGFMSIFVKAATAALLKYPDVNAYIESNDLVYHDYTDISVAVSTPTGLVVPVLRNTESMSFSDIEKKIMDYGQRAKKNQLSIEDMTGGTFTISNGGVFGSLMGTPILNPPQSAILGMHGTFKRPVVINDQVVARNMMYIALTYDHRIIDGSTAVLFLKEIKYNVENAERLLLSL